MATPPVLCRLFIPRLSWISSFHSAHHFPRHLSFLLYMFACLFLFVHDCTIARPLLRVYYIPFCAPILQLPQLGQAPALAVLLYYDCATLMCTEVTVMMRKKGKCILPWRVISRVRFIDTVLREFHSRVIGGLMPVSCTEATLTNYMCLENYQKRIGPVCMLKISYSKASSALRRTRRRTFFL